MRRTAVLAIVATALAAAGCGGSNDSGKAPEEESAESAAMQPAVPEPEPTPVVYRGKFEHYRQGAAAVTYNALVPTGATAYLAVTTAADRTTVRLTVGGLKSHRTYGAHLHTAPCGKTPAAAGPHYQKMHDPRSAPSKPSVDPSYANPRNEVWLDFTTDDYGAASSEREQPWVFTTRPRSLVIHAEKTKTGVGKAGMAGDRLACLTLPA